MQTQIPGLESELIEHNLKNTEQLFKLYNSLHFIYPAKMERLNPVFSIVKKNWEKAMKLNFPLFWILTIMQNPNNIFSTGTTWRYLNTGMIGQHLASNHPVGSRIIFLAMLDKIIENQHKYSINSYQIYYRPQNKYSSRMFEPLSIKAGKELSEIISYNYFEVPFLKYDFSDDIEVSEINNGNDRDFINFLITQKGELFVQAQELNTDDINLKDLDKKFNSFGLKRARRVFIARSSRDDQISGVIIVNQSSLGFNFSFFENSSELILCKQLSPQLLLQSARGLLYKASQLSLSSPLQWLPVLTDPAHTEIIKKLNGELTRNYNLFIMLKGGYETWYDHVDQLTNSVYQRFLNNAYEKNN
ncbi:MAG: hypothetical protein ABIN97_13640 [Ginsengibacter sp.]